MMTKVLMITNSSKPIYFHEEKALEEGYISLTY